MKAFLNQIPVPEQLEEQLLQLNNNSNRNNKKIKKVVGFSRFGAAAAIMGVVLLLGTTAYATNKIFGLSQYFHAGGFSEEARKLVDTDVTAAKVSEKYGKGADSEDIKKVEFNVTSALCDKKSVYLTVEANVKDADKYLILGSGADLEYLTMKDLDVGIDSDELVTDYCISTGRKLLEVYVDTGKNSKVSPEISEDWRTSLDGKLVQVLELERITDDNSFKLPIITGVNEYDDLKAFKETINEKKGYDYKQWSEEKTVTINDNSSKEDIATYKLLENDGKIEGRDAYLKELTLTNTEISTYSVISYIDNEDDDNGDFITFQIMNKDGEDAKGYDGCITPEGGKNFKDEMQYDLMEFTDTLSVRVYFKESGKSTVIKLTRVK